MVVKYIALIKFAIFNQFLSVQITEIRLNHNDVQTFLPPFEMAT